MGGGGRGGLEARAQGAEQQASAVHHTPPDPGQSHVWGAGCGSVEHAAAPALTRRCHTPSRAVNRNTFPIDFTCPR